MRPAQQNVNKQRSRGRGRGKPHSGGGSGGNMGANAGGVVNLNRTLDSNGPDVKIRGTVAHIYEKYQNLARDANSQGNPVGAENYLQHAEHYYRLLAAAHQAQAAARERDQSGRQNGSRRLEQPENGRESDDAAPAETQDDNAQGNTAETTFEENLTSTA